MTGLATQELRWRIVVHALARHDDDAEALFLAQRIVPLVETGVLPLAETVSGVLEVAETAPADGEVGCDAQSDADADDPAENGHDTRSDATEPDPPATVAPAPAKAEPTRTSRNKRGGGMSMKHENVLRAIAKHIAETGASPSNAEIAYSAGIAYASLPFYIRVLRENGYIATTGRTLARQIQVLKWPSDVPRVTPKEPPPEPRATVAKPAGPADDPIVAAHMEKHGVKKCPTGYAGNAEFMGQPGQPSEAPTSKLMEPVPLRKQIRNLASGERDKG